MTLRAAGILRSCLSFSRRVGRLGSGTARLSGSVLAASVALSGCARKGQGPESVIGISSQLEPTAEREAPPSRPPAVDPEVVHKAARAFTGYRPADDRSFERESFLTHLAAADAVCIGERHDEVLDHYAELAILEALAERRALRGFELSLGLEMVRKEFQGALTAYGQGLLSVPQLSAATNWPSEWGFPIEFYVPALDAARSGGAATLALGVDRSLTAAVAQKGVDGLAPEQRRDLPEIDFGSEAHHDLFESLMEGHPAGNPELLYEAQLVWDESMAEQSAAFLKAHAPSRKLVILAGSAHCHRLAIPDRIERRGAFDVVSVVPVRDQPSRPSSGAKPTPEQRLLAGYDYQLVFSAD